MSILAPRTRLATRWKVETKSPALRRALVPSRSGVRLPAKCPQRVLLPTSATASGYEPDGQMPALRALRFCRRILTSQLGIRPTAPHQRPGA